MHSDLIYDIGLHNGDDTAYYLHRGFRVVAVDADQMAIERARARFSDAVDAGRLTLLHTALSDHEGTAEFWICENGREWNSLHESWATRIEGSRLVEVPCTRLATIFRRHGVPHYLKIDIEGGEQSCLDDLRPDDLPRYLSVEMSDLPTLIRLFNLGYTAFQCVDQATKRPLPFPPRRRTLKQTLKLQVANHPRLRSLLREAHRATNVVTQRITEHDPAAPSGPAAGGWHFSLASSGPFGDDLQDRWQTVEEAAAVWISEWSRAGYPSAANRRDIWIDLHATRRATLPPTAEASLTHPASAVT